LRKTQQPDGFEYAQRTDAVGIRGVLRRLKAHVHMAHGGEVIYLVGLHFLDDTDQVGRIGKVSIMQHKMAIGRMRIFIKMIDPLGIKERGTSFDAVHLVSFV
jgi:hypothetical protein